MEWFENSFISSFYFLLSFNKITKYSKILNKNCLELLDFQNENEIKTCIKNQMGIIKEKQIKKSINSTQEFAVGCRLIKCSKMHNL